MLARLLLIIHVLYGVAIFFCRDYVLAYTAHGSD